MQGVLHLYSLLMVEYVGGQFIEVTSHLGGYDVLVTVRHVLLLV